MGKLAGSEWHALVRLARKWAVGSLPKWYVSSLASSSLPGISGSTVLSQGSGLETLNLLRTQEATLRLSYATAETKYGPKNPHLAEIANQLKSLHDQMQTEIGKIKAAGKDDLVLAQENEKALRSTFESQKRSDQQDER